MWITLRKQTGTMIGYSWTLILLLTLIGCSGTKELEKPSVGTADAIHATDQSVVEMVFLQLNDVYEITAVEGGARGGLARVATVRNELLAANPNTFTILAGDFLSPSALGTARVNGERLAGRHMVDVLNTMGLDMATFGNHEFDLNERRLTARIAEAEFDFVSGNTFDSEGDAIAGTIPYRIVRTASSMGPVLRVAVLGVTSAMIPVDYVTYGDYLQTVKDQLRQLKDSADVFVAMTHLTLAQDIQLANEVPSLALIMGGHEHENVLLLRGTTDTPIAKADANARTVYIHTIKHDFASSKTEVESRIKLIDINTPYEPETKARVDYWVEYALSSFRDSGFEPNKVVARVNEALDGRESEVRTRPTALTKLIAEGMRAVDAETDLSLYNAGSIRIDDVIQPGEVTEYDIIRILPFGGQILTVEMTGSVLDSVLTQGLKNKGSGGYLQTNGVREKGGIWFLGNEAILPNTVYRVAINDFLLSGREEGLGFLTLDNEGITEIARHGDIRFAVIGALGRKYPAKP